MISRPLQITIFLLLVGVLAGAIYMGRLQRREEVRGQAGSAAPLSAPVTGPAQNVDLMIAYDDDVVLIKESSRIVLSQEPGTRSKQILIALISRYSQKPSPHPLSQGSNVKEIFMVEDGLCVVDLNAAFAEGHRSGVMVEEMTIASMVESLSLNVPSIRRVKFLVEGKERETLAGHADLSMIYDVQTVHQLVAGLHIQ